MCLSVQTPISLMQLIMSVHSAIKGFVRTVSLQKETASLAIPENIYLDTTV